MALKESGWLGNKLVYVERTLNAEFVDILCEVYTVKSLIHPWQEYHALLVALYVLSGHDYVSSLFKTSKQGFLNVITDNCKYIWESDPLVELRDCENLGMIASMLGTQWLVVCICQNINPCSTVSPYHHYINPLP